MGTAIRSGGREVRPGPRPRQGVFTQDAAGRPVPPRTQGANGDTRSAERLANALGWFSIGLGVAQLVAPRELSRLVGVRDTARNEKAMRAIGIRELTAGVGLLTQQRPAPWAWSRVAGDAMDLALLGRAVRGDNPNRDRSIAATAAVLGVAALDVICAQRLSRNRAIATGAAPEEKGIFVQERITVNLPVEEVYAFWRDFENLPRFMKHLEMVQVTGDRRSHWVARAPAGRTVEWDAETIEDRPNELIAWRSIEGADVDNEGRVRFVPAPGARGTELHVDLRYHPPAGRLGSLVAKLFHEEPAQQVRGDLRRFKQVMEVGEVVRSDASIHYGPHAAQPPEFRMLGTI